MTTGSTDDTETDTLTVFEAQSTPGTPLTTAEVAAALDCHHRTAYNRLDALAGDGRLATKKVGARGRVWWRPVAVPTSPDMARLERVFSDVPADVLAKIFDASPVGLAIFDAAGRAVYANAELAALFDRPGEELAGRSLADLLPDSYDEAGDPVDVRAHPATQARDTGEAVSGVRLGHRRADGTERWLSTDAVPIPAADGTIEGVAIAAMTITEERQRERDLESQRSELLRLNRVNSVIRGVATAVTAAKTSDDLESAVCHHIAESDLYQFAVLGHFSSSHTEFEMRAAAGVGEEYLDAMLENPNAPPIDQGPGATAARTGEVQFVQHITDLSYDYWQEAAEDNRFQSYASIPLVHDDVVYGVLGVYAGQPVAFDAEERALLKELGKMVGYGLHALEATAQMRADQVVKLTFHSRALTELLPAFRDDSVKLSVDGIVPLEDGTDIQYWSVEGLPAREYVEQVRGNPRVIDVELLSTTEDGSAIEAHTDDRSLAAAFRRFDGQLTAASVRDDRLVVRGEFPVTVAPDAVEAAAADVYDDLTLVDQRLVYTPRLLYRVASERLTDRQWATVQQAYHAGYFEQPRLRTGKELAERMGVTPTTFHRHLRNAESELFCALFEAASDDGAPP